jgi:hypothetical protein
VSRAVSDGGKGEDRCLRVTIRGVLVFAFLALGLWGLYQALEGVQHQGLMGEVTCTGLNMGPDQEEHGQPMQPGDRCSPEGGSGIRTYTQQRDYQRQQHRRIVVGAWYVGAGAAGLVFLRLMKPYQARVRSRRSTSESPTAGYERSS